MKKILICGDVHFSQYSSILRERGKKYSLRLENIIKSVNFVEETARKNNIETIVYLGDFFDKPELNAEELTALQEIQWNINAWHLFLVGNHESDRNSLEYASTQCLKDKTTFTCFDIIDNIDFTVIGADTELVLIPYITEDNRKPLQEYLNKSRNPQLTKKIVLSHNDIKGIQYGKAISTTGFELNEIKQVSAYINGHIHNYGTFGDSIHCNLGNLTGQNFSEDAFKYSHDIMILDVDTLESKLIENPYAFNFYKLEINSEKDIDILDKLKDNAVITIKCEQSLLQLIRERLNKIKSERNNIVANRIITYRDVTTNSSSENAEMVSVLTLNKTDHLIQFNDFINEKLGSDEIVQDELSKILRG